jgi:Cu/Zn superoxide dismutase
MYRFLALLPMMLVGCPHRTPNEPPPTASDRSLEQPPVVVTPPSDLPDGNDELTALISGISAYPSLHGNLQLTGSGSSVEAVLRIAGLPPGRHAVHIHRIGDCSDLPGKSYGEPLDFANIADEPGIEPMPHEPMDDLEYPMGSDEPGGTTGGPGAPAKGNPRRIPGNLGDIEPDASGTATYVARLPVGIDDLNGRSVVVFAGPNDGIGGTHGPGAHAAIACGVIGADTSLDGRGGQ